MKKALEKIQKQFDEFTQKNNYQPSKLVIDRKYAENNFEPVPVSLFGMDLEVRDSSDMEEGNLFYFKGYKRF